MPQSIAATGALATVTKDIEFRRGEDVEIAVTVTGVDITGWAIRAVIRRTPGDPAVTIEKDSAGIGGIVLTTPASGLFTITILDTDTSPLFPGTFVWAAKRTDAGEEGILVEGVLTLKPDTVR